MSIGTRWNHVQKNAMKVAAQVTSDMTVAASRSLPEARAAVVEWEQLRTCAAPAPPPRRNSALPSARTPPE